jgi:2-methylcitrate dehydratase PrpD
MNHPVASERFARHALGTRYEDLSDDAVLQAKTFILDTIGVGIAGSSAAGADELSQFSAGWGEGAEACVWGAPQARSCSDRSIPQRLPGALPGIFPSMPPCVARPAG